MISPLLTEGLSYAPESLVEFVRDERITVWYSVPSALIMMLDAGLPALHGGPLRAVLFAGEPFPLLPLRRLRRGLPAARLLNLYGPTETNVCTYHEVDELADDRATPVPIGRACSGDEVWAVKADGTHAGPGEEGELMVAGPTVMLGYWGQPPQGDRPYATGDIVRALAGGCYEYIGRRDHMVKVRGHRIELGDVEAAIGQHPGVQACAVVVHGSGLQARLVAFVVPAPGAAPTLLELKRHCAERLPRYMIVDLVETVEALPRTRNGKIDRLALARQQ
jgi:clorobiocin biosynthesis protein CloN4